MRIGAGRFRGSVGMPPRLSRCGASHLPPGRNKMHLIFVFDFPIRPDPTLDYVGVNVGWSNTACDVSTVTPVGRRFHVPNTLGQGAQRGCYVVFELLGAVT